MVVSAAGARSHYPRSSILVFNKRRQEQRKMFLVRLPLALLTLTWQSAFLALGQIWANKVRALLTTIGIVIGVASVTAVISALSGLKQNVLNEFESFGTNKIFIMPD